MRTKGLIWDWRYSKTQLEYATRVAGCCQECGDAEAMEVGNN